MPSGSTDNSPAESERFVETGCELVGECALGKDIDALPPVLWIEAKSFGLSVAGLEVEDVVTEFSSSRFECIHEQLGDTGSSKVRSHPEPFDLTRRETSVTNRAQPNAAGEVPIHACNEVTTKWWAQRVKVSRHVVFDRAVAAVELIGRREYDAQCTG